MEIPFCRVEISSTALLFVIKILVLNYRTSIKRLRRKKCTIGKWKHFAAVQAQIISLCSWQSFGYSIKKKIELFIIGREGADTVFSLRWFWTGELGFNDRSGGDWVRKSGNKERRTSRIRSSSFQSFYASTTLWLASCREKNVMKPTEPRKW